MSGLADAVTGNYQAPKRKVRYEVNGKHIHFRFGQTLAWTTIVGLLGASFIAGVYLLGLETHWFFHAGSLFWNGWDFKHRWDYLFSFKSWTLYRHGIRNLLEPALFVMAGKTLLAKPKYWGHQASSARLILTPPLLVVLATGLAVGGVWLLDFGLPELWRHLFGTYAVTAPGAIANSSWQTILLGLLIGLVLHPIWAPVGATLQGFEIDRSVDKFRARTSDRLPLWVRFPLAPPVVRERFCNILETDTETGNPSASRKWVLILVSVLIVLVTLVGVVAKFYLAKGNTLGFFPFETTG